MDRIIEHEIRMEEWSQRIMQQKESGLTVKQWCTVNNITTHTYYYWFRKLKCRAFEAQDALTEPVFAPLPVPTAETSVSAASGDKIIVKANGIDIEMEIDVFLKYSKQIVETLSC